MLKVTTFTSNIRTLAIILLSLLFIPLLAEGQTTAREFYNLAVEKTDAKDYEVAVGYYNKAIELNPLFHEAWFSLGYTLQQMKQTDLAVAKYTRAIELQPKDIYYLQRCDAYMETGKDWLALWDCNKAIEMNPTFTEAYYKRAMLYDNLNKESEAAQDYTKVLKMGFTDDKLYFEIGWIYENLGQADSAIKYYQESIRRVPGERYAYIRIAEVSSRRGDDSTALDMYNRVIAAFPDYAYAYYHRGWLLAFTQNRRSDACLDFKKALELGYQEAKFQLDQICN